MAVLTRRTAPLGYRPGWFRARQRPPLVVLLPLQLLGLLVLLGCWQLLSERQVLDPLLFSKPTDIASRTYHLLAGEKIYGRTVYDNMKVTLSEIGLGYLIGVVTGPVAGFLVGRSRFLSRVFEPFVQAFFGIPKIAIAPFFVVILGVGLPTKVAIVAIEVFFIMFYNTFRGVLAVPGAYLEIAALMGCGRLAQLRKVMLPASLPSIIDGLGMAVPFAIVGAIVGEFISSNQGLGWLVLYSGASFDATSTFAAILILLALALLLTAIVRRLEHQLLPWRRSPTAADRVTTPLQ